MQTHATGAVETELNLSSTRILDVKGSIFMDLTGAGNTETSSIRLINSSRIDVGYDIFMTRDNTGANIDCEIVLENTAIINLTGDLDLTGSAGDDMTINMDDDSDFNITGDVSVDHSGGDEVRFHIDDDATLDITGDVSVDFSGGDDFLFYVNVNNVGAAVVTIGGDMTLNASGGDDLRVDIEEDGIINLTGDFTMNQDGGDELRLNIDQQGELNITGDFIVDQDGGDDIIVYINNEGGTSAELNISGNMQINHDAGDDILFIVDDANSELNITGTLTTVLNGTADDKMTEFNLDGGTMTAGAVSLTRTADYGRIEFDLDGGNATFTSVTANSSGTLFTDGGIHFLIDQASNFTCSNDMNITFTGADDCRFELNRAAGTTAQFNCGGDLNLTMTSGDDIELFLEESSQFNVTGDLIMTQSGGEDFRIALTDAASIDIDGDYAYIHSGGNNGIISHQAGGTCDFDVAGTFTVTNSGGGDEVLIDLNDGTMRVGSHMNLNVSGAGTTEDIDLELDAAASLTVIGNLNASLTGGDDIEIDFGNNTAASTASLACAGQINLTQNQSVAGRILRFRAFDDCTVSARGLNITHSNTAGDLLLVHLDNTATMTIAGDIDLAANGSGDIEIRTDATSELRISGDFDRTPGSFGELDMAVTSTLEFFGSANTQTFPQDAGAGGDIFDYGIIEVNNTFGTSPQITMEGLATVHGGMIFMDGVISSGVANILVVDAGATSTGASDDSHVDGLMRKTGADNFEFPSGDQGIWAPIEVTNLSANVDFDAEYFFVDHADVSVIAPLAYRSSIEHWTLDPSGAVTADVTLHWKDAARSAINTFTADLVVAHYDGADWESYGNDFMVAADPGEVRAEGVTVFSPFTFGSLSSNININPLPIELLSFEAHKNKEVVDLKWVTASETNNDYFVVERSENGKDFFPILTVDGAGNSSTVITYFDIDQNPLMGLSYYRLKQVDMDGVYTLSNSVPVMFSTDAETGITIFPNPVATSLGQVNLGLTGFDGEEVLVVLRDITGKEFYSKVEIIESGQALKAIPLGRHIPAGVYLVTASSNNSIYSKKLIIK